MPGSSLNFIESCQAAYVRLTENKSENRQQDERLLRAHRESKQLMDGMIKNRGKRYADATFDNYVVSTNAQQKVVEQLRAYAEDEDRIANGQNVLLIGPKGCGKDHLLMALAKQVFRNTGRATYWFSGIDLLEDIRQSQFNGKKRKTRFSPLLSMNEEDEINSGNTDSDWLFGEGRPLEKTVPILWVSDPLPPTGPMSEYQQTIWLSIIDRRYSERLCTWATLNVADGDECEKRMGAQATDRLRDGALVLFCNWESYRKSV